MTAERDALPIRLGRMLLHRVVPERWETSISGDLDEVWSTKCAGQTWGPIGYLFQVLVVSFHFSWETWKGTFRRKRQRAAPEPEPFNPKRRHTLGSILGPDLKYAFRCLSKSPGFTAIAVLIMGLGIGANTAIFSIVNGLLFASLPYKEAENLVRVYTQMAETSRPDWLSYPEFRDYRDGTDLFSTVAAASDGEPLSIVTEKGSEFVVGEAFSAELFTMLDVPPVLGRSFLPEENEPGSELVVMVSHSVWQQKHGGDPNVIGKTLQINGYPVTVVGVGPEGFQGTLVFITTDYWLSWGTADAIEPFVRLDERDSRDIRMFARLKPGVGLERAEAQLDTLAAHLSREYPESGGERRALVMPATEVRIDPLFDKAAYPISAFLMIVVGLVLVVACSNLAGLLLMRASSRQKEMALRQALGAGRWRLVSLLLTESALLGVLGGAVGLLIAFWTRGAILSYEPPLPVALSFNFQMDGRVLVFNLLLSIATGLLFGLAPALKASRCDLVGTLKDDVPALGLGRRSFNLRNFFVVVQVAVSLVLLVGAGLFVRNLINWQQVDPGFETERAALAVVDVSRAGYETEEKGRAFFEQYRENIASIPGVESVAIASRVPLGLWGMEKTPVRLPDAGPTSEEKVPRVELAVVSREFFGVLGIPILRGRSFDVRDTKSSSRVAVVSETMARRFWGSTEIIGETMILGSPAESVSVEVIGIARDTMVRSVRSAQREPEPYLYLPFAQKYAPVLVFIATTSGDPSELPETFRRELHALDNRVPLFDSKTMTEQLSLMLYLPRMTVLLLSSFGLLATALVSIGLYGLVAFSMSQRTREVGIRIALGARAEQVVTMVQKEGIKIVAVGLGVGLILASLVTRPLSVWFIDVSPTDPLTFAAVAMLLLGVTLAATYIPARRAAKSDPMEALRHE